MKDMYSVVVVECSIDVFWFQLVYDVVQVFYFLVDLLSSCSITESGVLNFPTITTELSISSFRSVRFCFIYFRAVFKSTHFMIFMNSK